MRAGAGVCFQQLKTISKASLAKKLFESSSRLVHIIFIIGTNAIVSKIDAAAARMQNGFIELYSKAAQPEALIEVC